MRFRAARHCAEEAGTQVHWRGPPGEWAEQWGRGVLTVQPAALGV